MYPNISKGTPNHPMEDFEMKFALEGLRWSIDLIQLFLFLDEYTDLKPVSFVEDKVNLVLDAANHPYKPRPEGEDPLGQMAQESVHLPSHLPSPDPHSYVLFPSVFRLALATSTENAGKHFIERFVQYLESLVEQAKNRVNDSVNTLEEYFRNRRLNSGTAPSCVPVELHLNLPDEAFYHPAIKEMELLAIDMICIDNVGFKIKCAK